METQTKEGRWGLTETDYHESTNTESRSGTPLGFARGGNTRPSSSGTLFNFGQLDSEELLPVIRQRLKKVEEEFKAECKGLLEGLAYQRRGC